MPWEKAWGATDGRGRLRVRFPPTAYFMMQRDLQTKRQIEKGVQILRSNGVPSDYVYVSACLQPLSAAHAGAGRGCANTDRHRHAAPLPQQAVCPPSTLLLRGRSLPGKSPRTGCPCVPSTSLQPSHAPSGQP
jgi:hypothetical protein